MNDILPEIRKLIADNQEFVIATVTKTWRSSPRPVGSSLLVTREGKMIGSVSGGCVEKAVAQKALHILDSGQNELLDYGVTDDEAWEVGLSCGGAISLHVDRFFGSPKSGYGDLWEELDRDLQEDEPVALITKLGSESSEYALGYPDGRISGKWEYMDDEAAIKRISEIFIGRSSQVINLEGTDYFVQVFPKKAVMLMIGSAHITSELLVLAHMHGFQAFIIDPRDTFASKTSFSEKPDKMLVNWPQEILPNLPMDRDTYAVVLSHDPKIDDAALHILLKSDVAYIGALGSRKTHQKRTERLKEEGFTDEQINRIHAPVGLDIGALLPREIALSVMAEVIAVKNGKGV